MTADVIFADAEALIVAYLAPVMTVPVVGELSGVRPASFVMIRRTGGVPRTDVSDSALITSQGGYFAHFCQHRQAFFDAAFLRTLLKKGFGVQCRYFFCHRHHNKLIERGIILCRQ